MERRQFMLLVAALSAGLPMSAEIFEPEQAEAAQKPSADKFTSLCESKLGYGYVWAAAGPTTFDCSGLIVWSLAQLGIAYPHQSESIIQRTTSISADAAMRTRGAILQRPGHVAVSRGDGTTIEAANPKVGVVSWTAAPSIRNWTRYGLIPELAYGSPSTSTNTTLNTSSSEEIEMIVIRSANRPAALVGPGFFRTLANSEELEQSLNILSPKVFDKLNDRQYDVIKAVIKGGTVEANKG